MKMIGKLSLFLMKVCKPRSMMRGVFTALFCLVGQIVFSQADNSYRTIASGLWNPPVNVGGPGSVWERYDLATTSWVAAAVAPSNASNVITIRSPHVITAAASISVDQVIIDVGGTLIINGPTAAAAVTVVDGASTDLTVNGTVQVLNGTLRCPSPAPGPQTIVVTSTGVIENSGSISNTNSTKLVFQAGATYDHAGFLSQIPTANWDAASNTIITANVASLVSGLSQSFGNFIWNTPTLDNEFDFAGLLTGPIKGNLSFINTGGTNVYLNAVSSAPSTLVVNGNMSIQASAILNLAADEAQTVNVIGNFDITGGTVVGSIGVANAGLNVTGNISLNGGSFDAGVMAGTTNVGVGGNYTNNVTTPTDIIKSESPVTTAMGVAFTGSGSHLFTSTHVPLFPVNFSTTGTGNLTISQTSFLAGTGTLAVGTGTTLTLLNTEGTGALRNLTTAGAVRVGSTRTYTGTVVYGGTTAQFMSADHPGDAPTRLSNTAGTVSMVGNVTFTTGSLDLTNNILSIGANTLTLTTFTQGTGSLGIAANSNVVVNGGTGLANLVFSGSPTLTNLTINRTTGTVTQATAALGITGTFNLTAGTLSLGAGSTTTISGPFGPAAASTLAGVAGSNLIIDGAGAMPTTLSMTGTMNRITMNRLSVLGITNTAPPTVDVTNLDLFLGSVLPTGGALRMATNGLVTRRNGLLIGFIDAVSVYDVLYENYTNPSLFTGAELIPLSGGVRHFTLNNGLGGQHDLTLGTALDASGNILISNKTLITGNLDIAVGGDFTIASGAAFTPGTSTLTFDGAALQTMSAPNALSMTNVLINKSGASNFTLSVPLTISNSFGPVSTSAACAANVGSGQLTLLSSQGATAFVPQMSAGSSIVGAVIVQRYLPNANGTRAYRYMASPVSTSVADWQDDFMITGQFTNPSTGPGVNRFEPSLYLYNETLVTGGDALGDGYVAYPGFGSGPASASPLVIGRGYAVFQRETQPFNLAVQGTIGQGAVPIAVTHSGGTNSGWNLVGNPYPSPIDWDLVAGASSGLDGAVYLTDNTLNSTSQNISYVANVSNPPGLFDGNLSQGQGFWVKVAAPGSGSVNLAENQKVAGQSQFLREETIPDVMAMALKQGNTIDYATVRLHDEATAEFDSKYDAYKFGASGLYITTLSKDNKQLSINALSRTACDNVVPVQIEGAVAGSYTIDFMGVESFGANRKIFLDDKVLNTRIEIGTTPQYAFTVSDIATLRDRFTLVFDAPVVETSFPVTGETTCETNALAYITLETSQTDVKYSATFNGHIVSSEITGTGGMVQIPITVDLLPQGENEISISAQMLSCDPLTLANKATITVVKKAMISSVKDGTTCGDGTVSLTATGTDATSYNWYEDMSDETPIAGANAAEFLTPLLTKTKTYYVAAVNAFGCEGDRMEVKAIVTNLEPALITAEDNVLTSSYSEGNQWLLDGLPIPNATGQEIEAFISGFYTVEVTVGTCKTTSEGREMVVTGMAENKQRVY